MKRTDIHVAVIPIVVMVPIVGHSSRAPGSPCIFGRAPMVCNSQIGERKDAVCWSVAYLVGVITIPLFFSLVSLAYCEYIDFVVTGNFEF